MPTSYRYSLILPVLALLVAAEPAAAQRRVSTQLRARAEQVLALETITQGGSSAPAGAYVEQRDAIVLRVKANCRWRLLALAADGVERTVWVRARALSGPVETAAPEFAAVVGGGALAQGGRGGDTEIALDYRVAAGDAPAALSFRLERL